MRGVERGEKMKMRSTKISEWSRKKEEEEAEEVEDEIKITEDTVGSTTKSHSTVNVLTCKLHS